MRFTLLLILLLPAFLTASPAKQKKADKPKQEKLATLYKNARTAIKNKNGQDGALNALLTATSRPELKSKQLSKIYYQAALLDESLNGVENKKAFLKQACDTAKFFNTLRDMYGHLRLCDSVDLAPNANGQVHARMQRRTRSLRLKHRRNIFAGGKYFLSKKDYASAYPFLDYYSSYSSEKVEPDTLHTQTVLWATLSAFLSDNYAGTAKHADEAISFSDSATSAILQEYKVRALAGLGNDSAWVAALKEGIEKWPEHNYFFVQLADWYQSRRNFGEERRLADELIRRTGGRAIHHYAKSNSYLSESNYDACAQSADSAIALQQDFVDAYYNKGIAYLNKAVIMQETSAKDVKDQSYSADRQQMLELYRQARPCMEMVRKLQPDRQDRWASPLYRIYLNLNLGEEFVEIDRLLGHKQ